MTIRVIVCGGRDYADRTFVYRALDHLHARRGVVELIQGDCPTGADQFAREWASNRGIRLTCCPADWSAHGRRAGPLRNSQMLALSPDGVVAFPGGRGTADMCRQAEAAGVSVWRPSP